MNDPMIDAQLLRIEEAIKQLGLELTGGLANKHLLITDKEAIDVQSSILLPQGLKAYNQSGQTYIVYPQHSFSDEDWAVIKSSYTSVISVIVAMAVVSLFVYHYKYFLFYFFRSKKDG